MQSELLVCYRPLCCTLLELFRKSYCPMCMQCKWKAACRASNQKRQPLYCNSGLRPLSNRTPRCRPLFDAMPMSCRIALYSQTCRYKHHFDSPYLVSSSSHRQSSKRHQHLVLGIHSLQQPWIRCSRCIDCWGKPCCSSTEHCRSTFRYSVQSSMLKRSHFLEGQLCSLASTGTYRYCTPNSLLDTCRLHRTDLRVARLFDIDRCHCL